VYKRQVISGVPVRLVFKSLKPLWIIVFLTLGIHIFTTPGNVIYQIGPLTATKEGVRQGLLMAARLVLLIAVSSLLTFTTSPIALTDGIERLLSPFKRFGLPAHELAMMMTIAIRFIPTLLEEADRILKAQKARGMDFETGGLIQRAKNLIPLLVPLFVNSFKRAEDLAIAMESRCYRGGVGRTRLRVLTMRTRDYAFLFVSLAIVVLSRFFPFPW
ncbi:MAG: energy-coupling factor transporter transmembrane protein EcfT, partial [Atribacterota bacterium]|nr:energy-coupling factor transporter transmembrane protein EcfT [Atribacterota bacterium]